MVRFRAIVRIRCCFIRRSIQITEVLTLHRCAYLRQIPVGLSDGAKTKGDGRVGVHLSYLT